MEKKGMTVNVAFIRDMKNELLIEIVTLWKEYTQWIEEENKKHFENAISGEDPVWIHETLIGFLNYLTGKTL